MAAPVWLWLPQAQKCNSYMMTYIMRWLLFGRFDFHCFPWSPWLPLGPWLPQAPKCNSYITTYIMKLLLLDCLIFLVCLGPPGCPWAPGWPRPQNEILT